MSGIAERIANLSPEKRALLGTRQGPSPVAIVGIGCRFPGGADSPDAFWRMLEGRVDAIEEIPSDRWSAAELFAPDATVPGKMATRWGGFLRGIDLFDAQFFDITSREAVRMDPQQRLLMETAWEALEDAGLTLETLAGSDTGVFVGIHSLSSEYYLRQVGDYTDIDTYTSTGSAHSIVANRLSYWLDLRGPSLAVDTACSSSLVAVHLAVNSLLAEETSIGVAAGVNLVLAPETTMAFSRLQMMAGDGRCKTFDSRADGFVRSEGCGVVVLKRLADALRDGDPIYALIRGSAVNQDGRTNGLTAPNGLAQVQVVRQALKRAKIAADAVDYVEAHGTGTALGDPIEIEALNDVLNTGPDRHTCVVTSVKTNIGHLEAAAGIAGLIKAALCLERARIPPHLHFRQLNPHIALGGTPFEIPTEGKAWPRGARVRFAGVSSFGFGGTNAHVILQEAPLPTTSTQSGMAVAGPYALPLAARTPDALRALAARHAAVLEADPHGFAAICYTAATRRTQHRERLVVIAHSAEAAAGLLRGFAADTSSVSRGTLRSSDVGESAKLDQLGERFCAGEAVSWAEIYPGGGHVVRLPSYPWQRRRFWFESDKRAAKADSEQWGYTVAWQPATPLQWPASRPVAQWPDAPALASAVEPSVAPLFAAHAASDTQALLNDLGELAAAYAAEALLALGIALDVDITLDDVAARTARRPHFARVLRMMLDLLVRRGRATHRDGRWRLRAPHGDTAAQLCAKLEPRLGDALLVGALLERCGSHLVEVLRGDCDPLTLLFPSDGRHSAADIYTVAPFARVANELLAELFVGAFRHLPAHATLRVLELGAGTGGTTRVILPRLPAERSEYVFTDLSRLFLEKARKAFEGGPPMRCELLDIERDPTAQGFGAGQFDVVIAANVLHATADLERALTRARDLLAPGGMLVLLEGTAQCDWVDLTFGLTEGWWRFTDTKRRGTYPLIDASQWRSLLVDVGFASAAVVPVQPADRASLFDQGIVIATKAREPTQAPAAATRGHWLVVSDPASATLATALCAELTRGGASAAIVDSAASAVDPASLDRALEEHETLRAVVDLRGSALAAERPAAAAELGHSRALGLIKEFAARGVAVERGIWLATRGSQAVLVTGSLALAQAPLWGLGRVAALELPDLWGGLIDLDFTADAPRDAATIVGAVETADGEKQVVLRSGSRLVARLAPHPVAHAGEISFSHESAYLVTGGLGGVGLQVARWLAEHGARHIVLVGRNIGAAERPGVASVLEELRARDVCVDVAGVDVGDAAAVASLVATFGVSRPRLRGVIHAAGIVKAAHLVDSDATGFAAHGRAKVAGTWHLHEQTKHLDLECFILFSSAVGIWGIEGLVHHAAANNFMIALAHERRALGLPALCVNWGWWAGDGATTEADHRVFRQIGLRSMTPKRALDALRNALAAGLAELTVAAVDWSVFKPVYTRRIGAQYLERIPAVSPAVAPEEATGVAAAPTTRRWTTREELEQVVCGHVAEILGTDPLQVGRSNEGFFAMGMDSIMTVELRNRMETLVGRRLPTTLAFEHPSVDKLVRFLFGEPAAPAVATVAVRKPEAQVPADLDDLSEDELAQLLDADLHNADGRVAP